MFEKKLNHLRYNALNSTESARFAIMNAKNATWNDKIRLPIQFAIWQKIGNSLQTSICNIVNKKTWNGAFVVERCNAIPFI